MKRCVLSLLVLALAVAPSPAHFIWIVPDGADGTKIKVVFSDDLEPDEGVAVEKIDGTKLLIRDAAGKSAKLEWKKGEHAYLASLPDKGDGLVGGVCKYGVTQRGDSKPFLLAYYPKLLRSEVKEAKPWDELPLEIVPLGGGRFQVLFVGKPAADSEVSVVAPTADGKETLKSDARGEFRIKSTAAGLHGIRARHIEAKAGEHDGKKYKEIRHYATLVFRQGKAIPGAISNGFTPASSVADGRLYVSTADGKVWRLTEKGDAWDEVGTLQRPRSVHRMVAAGNNLLLALGGASRAGNVDLTEVIVPGVAK